MMSCFSIGGNFRRVRESVAVTALPENRLAANVVYSRSR